MSIDIKSILSFIFGLLAGGCVISGLILYGISKMTDNQNGLAEGKMINLFIAGGVCTAAIAVVQLVKWTY